jgi:hypothetical protein
MDKNKRSAQTDTGAVDIKDIKKRKMIKAVTQSEFSDMPGGFGLPMKEAKEKVKKLESQQEARKARRNEAGEPVGMKKAVQLSPQLLNEPTVLLKKVKPVEKWSDVFNEQHSVF